MLPEQQQPTLGYFIEESKDHLNTIEQGLLNLHNTLKDPQMVNEVFRAAQSIKGGAAMLGLPSLEQTAHRLEDYFQVLKECPTLQVDQKLESMFLRVFDTLQELLEQLESEFCLKEDVTNNLMSEVEPVFEALNEHLGLLVKQAGEEELPAPSSLSVFEWQHEEILELATTEPGTDQIGIGDTNEDSNFFDLLFEEDSPTEPATTTTAEDLTRLFGDRFLEEEHNDPQNLVGATDATRAALPADATGLKLPSESGENSLHVSSSPGSNEMLAIDSLFELAQDTPQNVGSPEPNFGDLFDTTEETEESLDFLETLSSDNATEDFDLRDFWEEEAQPQAKDHFEVAQQTSMALEEDWFAACQEIFSDLEEPPAPNGCVDQVGLDLELDVPDAASAGAEVTTEALEDLETLFDEEMAEFSEYLFGTDMALDHTLNPTEEMVGEEPTHNMALEAGSPAADLDELEDFADLEALLGEEAPSLATSPTATNEEAAPDEFSQLEALLDEEAAPDEFSQLEALLDEEAAPDEFSQLEALLDLDTPAVVPGLGGAAPSTAPPGATDEFGDLEKLLELEEVDKPKDEVPAAGSEVVNSMGGSPTIQPLQEQAAATNSRRSAFEQTMRVPVKQLDNINNMVGELVVNRNSLEQDQERLRQSLDNLLHQVQQLSDLGAKMQQLYERSLLEASLQAIRQGSGSAFSSAGAASNERHATGMDFDALEMDRFTGFHTLSQEMIELVVRVRESSSDIEFVTDETEQVARQLRQVTSHLQEGLTRSRMIPFAQIADRLPRAVRDIALKYGKQAELHIEGRDTLIDKVLLEQLYDPMTHLVNNSITHGIETSEERLAKGKSPVGQITVRAFHQGNQTVISVSDDGAGIDTDRVMTKAIQKGLITVAEARTMSRLDVYNLLFHPGFSTKDKVDDYAGRGVGMDVVRTSLSEIRGVINTDSTLGKGTTFTIRLPLTLSICKALCCLSDKAWIAFPMDGVEDMLDIPAILVQVNAEGQSCIPWRDSLLPFRPLKELLTYNRQLSRSNVYGGNREDDMISIVVLRSAGTLIALQVDQVLGEQEIVIKQFEGPAPKPVGVAGATVLGDGRIMPIADVLELIDLSMGRIQPQGGRTLWATSAAPVLPKTPASVKTEPTVLIIDDSITVRELLSMTFNKAGYRVEQARDGQEAWEKLRNGLPCDIVFCDIEMPKMDGLELLSRMQKEPSLSQLPIAMLTSRGADRHRQMAVQLGARGYFTKPYIEEALLDGAQRMLKGEVLVTTNSNA